MGLGGDGVIGSGPGQYKRTPVTAGPQWPAHAAAPGPGWSLGHRRTRWQRGNWILGLPPPEGVWPTHGSPKPGLWRDQRVLGKGPESMEAGMEQLVIPCSSPGSPPLSCIIDIFLSWSEHLKAS